MNQTPIPPAPAVAYFDIYEGEKFARKINNFLQQITAWQHWANSVIHLQDQKIFSLEFERHRDAVKLAEVIRCFSLDFQANPSLADKLPLTTEFVATLSMENMIDGNDKEGTTDQGS